MPVKPIEDVLAAHTDSLMALPGVIGTAQGLCGNKPCIQLYVVQMTPGLRKRIPNELEGYQVAVQETGEIRALPDE